MQLVHSDELSCKGNDIGLCRDWRQQSAAQFSRVASVGPISPCHVRSEGLVQKEAFQL